MRRTTRLRADHRDARLDISIAVDTGNLTREEASDLTDSVADRVMQAMTGLPYLNGVHLSRIKRTGR